MTAPLLLVEDDARVADFVKRGLAAEGHQVSLVSTAAEAAELARAHHFDCMILDVMLPGGQSGIELCRQLRAVGDVTPILMLTALDSVEDKVAGLDAGADDYLVKPFAFSELVARVAALLRRQRGRFEIAERQLKIGDLELDRAAVTASRGGQRVRLTAKEFAVLEAFMLQPGKVLSRARILESVWGYSADRLTNVVDVYIRRLRRSLGDEAGTLITTVRGYGYKLDPDVTEN